jgi:hypothetical protein
MTLGLGRIDSIYAPSRFIQWVDKLSLIFAVRAPSRAGSSVSRSCRERLRACALSVEQLDAGQDHADRRTASLVSHGARPQSVATCLGPPCDLSARRAHPTHRHAVRRACPRVIRALGLANAPRHTVFGGGQLQGRLPSKRRLLLGTEGVRPAFGVPHPKSPPKARKTRCQ